MSDFSTHSYVLNKKLDLNVRRSQGIYFTPTTITNYIVKFIKKYTEKNNLHIAHFIEPSCGSGEFLNTIEQNFPDVKITGIENNIDICNYMNGLGKNIIHADYLTIDLKSEIETNDQKLELDDIKLKREVDESIKIIIGNPPYFVMKKQDVVEKYADLYSAYSDILTGRPNIFIYFILKSMSILDIGDILSFVLPNNFMTCVYYSKIRMYIAKNYKILDLVDCNTICGTNFRDTKQETFIFTVQKVDYTNELNSQYIIDDSFIFANDIDNINKLYVDSISLMEIPHNIQVGNIVWNQVKEYLSNEVRNEIKDEVIDKKNIRLIYGEDITDDHKISKYRIQE